ncbi:COP9 signalosome complex subunit 9-like [Camelus dromedarius]|uniref:COP9 signalosome complex subunit 9 n=1 Tax=Camelus bactrianus TaxID=9837 RepID=A0A9W3FV65_CAMBA|nr:COP9 signalosome complex subunit 9-like [Camelus bactrianus]
MNRSTLEGQTAPEESYLHVGGNGLDMGRGVLQTKLLKLKPAVDEMFPEGTGPYVDLDEAGGSTRFLMDLTANEKAVHADFCNEFDDDDIE